MEISLTPSLSAFNAVVACTAIWAFVKLMCMSLRRVRTTRLRGPPSLSLVYGVGKILLEVDDPASIHESWAQEYGAVYEIPSALGGRRIILYDPKTIAHFHAKETWTYVRTPMIKKAIEQGVSIDLLSGVIVSDILSYRIRPDEACFGLKERVTGGMFLNLLWRRKLIDSLGNASR